MQKSSLIFLILLASVIIPNAIAQDQPPKNELTVSDQDLIILFTIAIAIVIGIFIYIARDVILRRRTFYDKEKFDSKKNRDYEKYHSDWMDENVGFESRKTSKYREEFRNASRESKFPNYYELLGISTSASANEIKQKFRKLAKEIHPDKSKISDSKEKMAELNKAYEVLSDNEKRSEYDKYFKLG